MPEERVRRPQSLPADVVEHISYEQQVQAAMQASLPKRVRCAGRER